MKNKFIIKDWTGNIMFNGKTFKTFDDAWDYLFSRFDNDEDLEEFFVEKV